MHRLWPHSADLRGQRVQGVADLVEPFVRDIVAMAPKDALGSLTVEAQKLTPDQCGTFGKFAVSEEPSFTHIYVIVDLNVTPLEEG